MPISGEESVNEQPRMMTHTMRERLSEKNGPHKTVFGVLSNKKYEVADPVVCHVWCLHIHVECYQDDNLSYSTSYRSHLWRNCECDGKINQVYQVDEVPLAGLLCMLDVHTASAKRHVDSHRDTFPPMSLIGRLHDRPRSRVVRFQRGSFATCVHLIVVQGRTTTTRTPAAVHYFPGGCDRLLSLSVSDDVVLMVVRYLSHAREQADMRFYHSSSRAQYKTGSRYAGEWQGDMKHGYGAQTWVSGNKYEGVSESDHNRLSAVLFFVRQSVSYHEKRKIPFSAHMHIYGVYGIVSLTMIAMLMPDEKPLVRVDALREQKRHSTVV